MKVSFAVVCLLMVTSVATGQSVQSTTPSPGSVQQLKGERQVAKNACKNDGGGVVAPLVQQLFAMNDKLHALQSQSLATQKELEGAKSRLSAELDTTRADLGSQIASLSTSKTTARQGSSFIRWGRKACPNNTTLVYSGVAGGKLSSYRGGGSNRLCLTRSPQFDNTPRPSRYDILYGAEYEYIHGHHDHDVPCSVCQAPQSTTIMVPATLTCPAGWTPQYSGHLASEYYNNYGGEYVCLDGNPEDDSSGRNNYNGLSFYYVITACGSLPCPPYISSKVVTCVVCSN